jgi:hypothetical protein
MKKCIICATPQQFAFTSTALKKYPFEAMICPHCGFLQVQNSHWLAEAYGDAIAACDTGLVARNLLLAERLLPLIFHLFGANGHFVDFAGGTGLLVRLMRDAGYDFYWSDPYCVNIHARGLEFKEELKYTGVTAFEVLEHLVDPISFVDDAMQKTNAEAFFFTTELFSGLPPNPDEWWYYAFDAGQHISFYQTNTLEVMAKKLDMSFISNAGIHVFCKPILLGKLRQYFSSPLLRGLIRYKLKRILQSKTMPDHLALLGKLK